MSKSKTHLVAVRVDDRVNAEIEELFNDTQQKDKADFLREIIVAGLYSYRKEIYQSHEDRCFNSLVSSYERYKAEMTDEDFLYIRTRFDQLELMIKAMEKQPASREERTILSGFFKK